MARPDDERLAAFGSTLGTFGADYLDGPGYRNDSFLDQVMAREKLDGRPATDSEIGLAWLADNSDLVKRLAANSCRGHYHLCDDLWSEAVDRVEMITACYIPGLGHRTPHMARNLRWYFYKWMNKKLADAHRCASFTDITSPEFAGYDPTDPRQATEQHELCIGLLGVEQADESRIVAAVLDKLCEYHKTLIILYHAHDKSFNDIAQILGCSKGTVRLHYITAIKNAQQLAQQYSLE